jgi:hypothetical protein
MTPHVYDNSVPGDLKVKNIQKGGIKTPTINVRYNFNTLFQTFLISSMTHQLLLVTIP